MLVEDLKFEPTWITGPAYEGGKTRSDGLHLSQIYGDIEATLVPRDEMEPQLLSTFRSGGFIWERVFDQAFAGSLANGDIVRPDEWSMDGIIGSPDLIDIRTWTVIDTKCTWKTVRKWENMEKYFWVWLMQLKGYCKMVGSQTGVLHVFFVNGDYKGSGPTIKSRRMTWSQHEIDENWKTITGHARKRGWL